MKVDSYFRSIYLNEEMYNCWDNPDIIYDPVYDSPFETGSKLEITYYMYDEELFPKDKYEIHVLDYIFDSFNVDDDNCDVFIKISIKDIEENKTEIKYIQLVYDGMCRIFDESRYYDIAHILIQGVDIIEDLYKAGDEKIPQLKKKLNSLIRKRVKQFDSIDDEEFTIIRNHSDSKLFEPKTQKLIAKIEEELELKDEYAN